MKGVVLAGGLGTRLYPLTRITNKHVLPVYDRPMIYYPIQCIINAAITDIMVVTGGAGAGEVRRLLGNGEEFGLDHLHYAQQEGKGGVAEALGLARDFAGTDRVLVVLGDNIIEKNIRRAVGEFSAQPEGARILLKEVDDPRRFGVARFDGDSLVGIEEKPAQPPSNYAVIGIYMYDNHVWDILPGLVPSARGEFEITDVNNAYIKAGKMACSFLDGWWTDAGTFGSLHRASCLVEQHGANKIDDN
jgi:glucose-1-phosphate thymidylyltransferase